ncbi:hypothetical protein DUI87_11473 [Hirundo rustica rustica]|uniref:GDNF/GAS1 domain-containing protein n=1 Tax=Hirundo rustica rustica TaxID=333673 RepID=A0A3M0KJH8_HIRRU|nr:hypothetical protein DUI87_11473 [Hirundo rustica rustica]
MEVSGMEPVLSKGNNCLDAAKACNLNDTCKRFRSAYITPCTSSTSNEICNKRKCHKALRLFFDKVPPKHSYGMLFCSCRDVACTERRRQTIVPVCSYEDREKPNCLNLQESCKKNYICRSRLADFFTNCQPESRSVSSCLKENYADCLLAYSGLIENGIALKSDPVNEIKKSGCWQGVTVTNRYFWASSAFVYDVKVWLLTFEAISERFDTQGSENQACPTLLLAAMVSLIL